MSGADDGALGNLVMSDERGGVLVVQRLQRVQPACIEMVSETSPDVAAKVEVMLYNILNKLQLLGLYPEAY